MIDSRVQTVIDRSMDNSSGYILSKRAIMAALIMIDHSEEETRFSEANLDSVLSSLASFDDGYMVKTEDFRRL